MADLTAELLRKIFRYDPETGLFTSTRYRDSASGEMRIVGSPTDKGYVRIAIGPRFYRAHRLAWLYMTGEWPAAQVDHINGIPDDNRWSNLRAATNSQNQRNRRPRRGSRVPYKGVCWEPRNNKFYATIQVNGRTVTLPRRLTPEEAHADYCAAARAHYGEFARAE